MAHSCVTYEFHTAKFQELYLVFKNLQENLSLVRKILGGSVEFFGRYDGLSHIRGHVCFCRPKPTGINFDLILLSLYASINYEKIKIQV